MGCGVSTKNIGCQMYLSSIHIFLLFASLSFSPSHRRTGRGGRGGAAAPPIRAVCGHEFGQRVEIIRAKHNTCVKNTNLVSDTGVNGKKPRI